MSNQNDSDNDATGQTSRAPIAADKSRQAGTERSDTVTGPARKRPTERGGELHNPLSNATCQHCGRPYLARRPWSKYCSGACRIAAWRARRTAATAIVAAVNTILLWVFWIVVRGG